MNSLLTIYIIAINKFTFGQQTNCSQGRGSTRGGTVGGCEKQTGELCTMHSSMLQQLLGTEVEDLHVRSIIRHLVHYFTCEEHYLMSDLYSYIMEVPAGSIADHNIPLIVLDLYNLVAKTLDALAEIVLSDSVVGNGEELMFPRNKLFRWVQGFFKLTIS